MSKLEIRKAVKERYTNMATSSDTEYCGRDGCSNTSIALSVGEGTPIEASFINAGYDPPLLLVSPKEGDVVLDLGSGGGIDIFRTSQIAGDRGKVIDEDTTPEMVWRARETKSKYGSRYANTEFRLGEFEYLPIESDSEDCVISDCVINLFPVNLADLGESYRVPKGGGTFAFADVTLSEEHRVSARNDVDSWSACVAGVLTGSSPERLLESAGFQDVQLENVSDSNTGNHPFSYHSSHIKAKKPLVSSLNTPYTD